MTFLTPTLALVAAAIAVPALLILYFLKLRRRQVEVSTTLLWKKAIQDLQANAPFQRLRRNILLLLQLLALAAALLALAQPQSRSLTTPGGRHVLLIDRSASMQATDGDPARPGTRSRLDQAKAEALRLIDALREPDVLGEGGEQAMVVAFDSSAVVLSQFSTSKALLRRAVEGITPTDAPTSVREAVRLARAQAQVRKFIDQTTGQEFEGGATGAGIIHIFSDGNLPDLLGRARPGAAAAAPADDMIAAEDVVVYHPAGTPTAWNVGITGLRAERAFDDPRQLSLFVGLQSTAPDPKTVEVTLSIEGRVAAVRDVPLAAASRTTAGPAAPPAPPGDDAAPPPPPGARVPAVSGVVFKIDRPDGAVVTVRVRVPEAQRDEQGPALDVDDIGYLIVPPARRLAVAIVTDGNLFLSEVLAGLVLARPLKTVPTADGQAFVESAQAGEYDVIILDRWLPSVKPDEGASTTAPASASGPGLPPGRFLVFGRSPPPPMGLEDLGDGEPSVVLDWRRDHPVLRNLSLDSVVVSPSRRTQIPAGSSATPLATGTQGPLIVEASDPARRAIVVTFDLMRSTWPFDPPSFVVFVVRSLEYLAGIASMDSAAGALRPGQTLSARLPPTATEPRLVLPDGREQSLVLGAGGEVNFAPVDRAGVYTLAWTGVLGPTDVPGPRGSARRAVAVNLLDPGESDVAAQTTIQVASNAQVIQAAGRAPGATSLWPWLIFLVLSIVMVEWWVYHRKVAI